MIETPEKDWTYEEKGCEGDVERGRVLLKRETADGSYQVRDITEPARRLRKVE